MVPTKDAPELQKLAEELNMSIEPKEEHKSVSPIESVQKPTRHLESAEQKSPNFHFQHEMNEKSASPSNKFSAMTEGKKSEPENESHGIPDPSLYKSYSAEDPISEANASATTLPNETLISQGKSQEKENSISTAKYHSAAKSLSRSPSSKVWEKVSQIERSRSNSSNDNHSLATPAEAQLKSLESKSFESPSKDVGEKIGNLETSPPKFMQTVPEWKQEFSPSQVQDTNQVQKTCEHCLKSITWTRETTKADNNYDEVKPKVLEENTGESPISKNQNIPLGNLASEATDTRKESENVPISKSNRLKFQNLKVEKNEGQNETQSSLEEENPENGNFDAFKTNEPATKETDDQWPVPPLEEDLVHSDVFLDHPMVPANPYNGPMCFCQAVVKVGDLHHDDIRGTLWRIIERKTKKLVYRKK